MMIPLDGSSRISSSHESARPASRSLGFHPRSFAIMVMVAPVTGLGEPRKPSHFLLHSPW